MTFPTPTPDRRTRLQQVSRYMFFGFAAIAAFFLITEHGAHLLGWLPFLIILACPLIHVFGHGGHNHGGGTDTPDNRDTTKPEGTPPPPGSSSPPAHHHH